MPEWLHVSTEVEQALRAGAPVVALETTVITHGLPRPINLEIARALEEEARLAGVVPATIGVVGGKVRVGLTAAEVEHLAAASGVVKVSRRDLGVARARSLDGGTTVAATMHVAHAASIRTFATGGIGGVHRGPSGDISADLPELARTPVAVVCSGAKSVLDLPRTLEWLETAGVPVLGWQTDEFPAFFTATSGLPVSARVEDAPAAAAVIEAHWSAGLETGLVIAVPCPESEAVPQRLVEAALAEALDRAERAGVRGKDVTPFLLARLAETTEGATLRANQALLRRNVRVAAQIARALSHR